MENNIDEKSYVDSDIEEIDEVHSNMGTYSNLGNVSNPFKDITSSFDAPNLSTELYNAIPSVFQDKIFGMFNRAIASPIIDTADFAIRTADTAIRGFATGVNELKNLYTGENDDRLKRDIYGFFTAGSPVAATRPVNISGRVKQLIDKGDNIEAGKLMYSHVVNPVAAMSVKKAPSMAKVKPKETSKLFNSVGKFPALSKSEETLVASSSAPVNEIAGLGRVKIEKIDSNDIAGSKKRFEELKALTSGYKHERAKAKIIRLENGENAIQYMQPPTEVTKLNISDLIATQDNVILGTNKTASDVMPLVVKKDGKFFIRDGHHRIAQNINSGDKTADVKLIDLDKGGFFGVKATNKQTDQMIPVFPKREALFPKGEAPKGGDYLNPVTGEVLTNRNVSSANVKIKPDGNPDFKVSNDNIDSVGTIGKGNTDIKVNLFKRFSQKPKEGTTRSPDAKGNWRWTKLPEGISPNTQTIISVKQKGNHYFTLETDFSKGVSLKTYPNQKSEPRLKPTVVGKIELGNPVGEVIMRGEKRIVYDKITTFNTGGLVKKKGLMSRA